MRVGVCAILRFLGGKTPRVLLIHRKDSGRWEFPGGKVECGEHPIAAVARELKEETGIVVLESDFALLGMTPHVGRDGNWWLGMFFVATVPEEWLTKLDGDHDYAEWVPTTSYPRDTWSLASGAINALEQGLTDGWIIEGY